MKVVPTPEPKNYLEYVQPKRSLERAVSTESSTKVVQLTQPEPVTSTQEQIIEEEEVITEKKIEKAQETEFEEVEELRLKYLLDEEVSAQRVSEIDHAIEKAHNEAQQEAEKDDSKEEEKVIEGWRIIKFLPLHIGLISQIVKHKGNDGSLDETVQDLASRKFASVQEAKEQSKLIIFEKEPVKRGKEGKTVKEGSVERVLKYPFVRRGIPKEEVVARIVKKQKVQMFGGQPGLVVAESAPQVKESSIEDYPDLAEVFQKAA